MAEQDYPLEAIELIFSDGGSRDGTIDVIRSATEDLGFGLVLVVDSPDHRIPVVLNRGLAAAGGEYLVRVDSRARVPPHYVRSCVEVLAHQPEVGVVGGAQVALPRSARRTDRAIARALRNRWSMGMSRYRRSTRSGPSDTVWMGAFRTGELRQLGGWDEDFALNEDYELNQRYRLGGSTVWFDASLRSHYLPRPDVARLARQYFSFGRSKGTAWARGMTISPRHAVLLSIPLLGLLGTVVLWRRRGIATVAAVGTAGVVAVEVFGGDPEPAPVDVRVQSAALNVLIVAAWLAGAVVGFGSERLDDGSRRG